MMQRVWTPYSKHAWERLRNTIQTLQDPCSSHLLFLFLFFLFTSFFSCDFITAQLYWRRASCAVLRSAEKKGVRDCGRKLAWQGYFLRMPKWEGRKRRSGTTLHLSSTPHRPPLSSPLSLYLSLIPPELSGIAPSKYGPDEGSSGGTAHRPADNQSMQVSWKRGSPKLPYKQMQYNLDKYPPNNRFFFHCKDFFCCIN